MASLRFTLAVIGSLACVHASSSIAGDEDDSSMLALVARRRGDCGKAEGQQCCPPSDDPHAWWWCDDSLSLTCTLDDGTGTCVKCGGGDSGTGTCCNAAGSMYAGGLPNLDSDDYWCDGTAVCDRETSACSPVSTPCGKEDGQRCCDKPGTECSGDLICQGRNKDRQEAGTCSHCGYKDDDCCELGEPCPGDGLSCIQGMCRDISNPGWCGVTVEPVCKNTGSTCKPKNLGVTNGCSSWAQPNMNNDSDPRDHDIYATTFEWGLCGSGNCGVYWPGSGGRRRHNKHSGKNFVNSTQYGCKCVVAKDGDEEDSSMLALQAARRGVAKDGDEDDSSMLALQAAQRGLAKDTEEDDSSMLALQAARRGECGKAEGQQCCQPSGHQHAWRWCDESLSFTCTTNDETGICVKCGGGKAGTGTCCNTAGSMYAAGLPNLHNDAFWCDATAVCNRKNTSCMPDPTPCGEKDGERCCDKPGEECFDYLTCQGQDKNYGRAGTCTKCGYKDIPCCDDGDKCSGGDNLTCIQGMCRDTGSNPGWCTVTVEPHCNGLGGDCHPKNMGVKDGCTLWNKPTMDGSSDPRDFGIQATTFEFGLCGSGNCGLYWSGSGGRRRQNKHTGTHVFNSSDSADYGCQCVPKS